MEARPRRLAPALGAVIAIAAFNPTTAGAEVAHVVQPGETLWSIAAANNLTTRTVAVYNGLAEDASVVLGQTVMVPTVDEGAAALASAGVTTAPAPVDTSATGGHTVVAGESLSSIAAANGLTIDELAAANGRSSDSFVYEGEALTIPAPSGAASSTSPTAGLGHVPSPYGELHLDPSAADSWNAMREEALSSYGVDIYPGGPLSAYRTTEQQQELYDLYLSGQGAPANPPGTSSHETGLSVDLETPEMRSVIDAIGGGYGWGKLEAPDEWWHVSYGG
jgi:LysM repeat protein